MSISISDRRQIIQEFLDWHEDQASGAALPQALENYIGQMRARASEETLREVAALAEVGATAAEILDVIEAGR